MRLCYTLCKYDEVYKKNHKLICILKTITEQLNKQKPAFLDIYLKLNPI